MQALIFDIDGTLWDTRAIVARGYNVELERMGLGHKALTADSLTALFGKTAAEIADVIFAEFPESERMGLILRCMETERLVMAADPCDVGYAGVKETLLALKKKYRLFLVSNSEKGYPELLIEKLGLQGIFEAHMCHGDTGLPKGDTIRILMERHEIESAVYIGDTQGDLEACEKAGIPFVFCAYGFGKPARWDAKIHAITELPEVLQTL